MEVNYTQAIARLDALDSDKTWQWALNEMSDNVNEAFNDVLRAAAAIERAAREYAKGHHPDCAMHTLKLRMPCSCGYDALIAALGEAK